MAELRRREGRGAQTVKEFNQQFVDDAENPIFTNRNRRPRRMCKQMCKAASIAKTRQRAPLIDLDESLISTVSLATTGDCGLRVGQLDNG
jgi:hypothetical protein